MEAANVYGQQEEQHSNARPARAPEKAPPAAPPRGGRGKRRGLSIGGHCRRGLAGDRPGFCPRSWSIRRYLGSIIRRSANLEGTLSYQSASVRMVHSASRHRH